MNVPGAQVLQTLLHRLHVEGHISPAHSLPGISSITPAILFGCPLMLPADILSLHGKATGAPIGALPDRALVLDCAADALCDLECLRVAIIT